MRALTWDVEEIGGAGLWLSTAFVMHPSASTLLLSPGTSGDAVGGGLSETAEWTTDWAEDCSTA